MKVPVSWLKEYVTFEASPAEIADRLTFSGIEVEGIRTVGGTFDGIVVAEVVQIAPHPKADRLVLCDVADGREVLRVVCGARNFAVGDKVPLARVGARLPGGMEIKEAKLRGELSRGMLCAEDELGLSDDHSGLMLLPRHLAPGTPLAEVAGPPETVLDLEITWNRPDCLSIIGIAREIAALFGATLRLPEVGYPEAGQPVSSRIRVFVDDPLGCPRYTARYAEGIRLGPSPAWMQKRLTLCGVRPISNIVDVTNYVMLETGQPLHAFDYRLLTDQTIRVRRAQPAETMATLDGVPRPLTPEMLLIADAVRPVAVAGVMGGAGSEIRDSTDTVLLESACFNQASIHATSQALDLATESSHRFERGVDVESVDWASRRAMRLMLETGGGAAACGVVDVYPGRPAQRQVRYRFARGRSLLGVDIADDRAVQILSSLGLAVGSRSAEECLVQVPGFRPDIELEADLIEEVARIHGLDRVPAATPRAVIVPDANDRPARAAQAVRGALVGLGLSEILNYSFVSAGLLDRFDPGDAAGRIVLPNPVSADHGVLRNALLPQMVETLGRNLARQNETAALFEMGRVYLRGAGGELGERERLCIGLMGRAGRLGWDVRRPCEPEEMFLWIKGLVVEFCQAQPVADLALRPIRHPAFEDGWCLEAASAGERLGVLGLVRRALREEWRLSGPVGVAELELGDILRKPPAVPAVSPLPAYPSVARDLALVVGEDVKHEDVLRTVWAKAPKELIHVHLFDIFRSPALGEGKKSLAYEFVYRSMERTLTDEDVNQYNGNMIEALRSGLGAEIRVG